MPPDAIRRNGCARAELDTPIGVVTVVASEEGIREVVLPGDGTAVAGPELRTLEADDPRAAHLTAALAQLGEYFGGARTTFDVPLDPIGTEFERGAWDVLRGIPYGETISYGEQAERMGDRRKARAVGGANGRNPIAIVVPCHRVVGADGSLTGFGGGIEVKRWLLDHESGVARLRVD
ncbi:MAG: methylated-DNA--[protein]-cysteine S-methyltransferase [Actinobacteria bacterium]|nr:methylated-DNA--[protein]-cysteine S-methyltransferase [Actinomycetota bacterium]